MKFPKEKVRLVNLIKEYLEQEDFYSIYKLKDDIFLSFDELKQTSIFNHLLYATFNLGHFDGVILISDELQKKGYESFELIYFTLLSFIANTDIYQAVLFIKKSKILNMEEIKVYHSIDGANYSNILHFDETLSSSTLALVITNFVEGIAREMIGDRIIDQEYILYRFFDLINLILELGYPAVIINELTEVMKVVFLLEV